MLSRCWVDTATGTKTVLAPSGPPPVLSDDGRYVYFGSGAAVTMVDTSTSKTSTIAGVDPHAIDLDAARDAVDIHRHE